MVRKLVVAEVGGENAPKSTTTSCRQVQVQVFADYQELLL
jgi:hypothetical protein